MKTLLLWVLGIFLCVAIVMAMFLLAMTTNPGFLILLLIALIIGAAILATMSVAWIANHFWPRPSN